MNSSQRQPPTREQVVQHLKGQIALRQISLELAERRRSLVTKRINLAEAIYAPYAHDSRDNRQREHLRYEIALEEAQLDAAALDLQIGDMKSQMEQLQTALTQTESGIITPGSQGVLM